MMTKINISDDYDNEIVERKPRVYQLEIKKIWTPNLAIAKYNVDESRFKRISINEDPEEKEYREYRDYVFPLTRYLNNVFDFYDRVIFSPNNLKEILKPGDIIQTDYIYKDRLFKLNENVTLFIFEAYKTLYPKILVRKVTKLIFDTLYNNIRPHDRLFSKIYTILRAAEVSFRGLGNIWNYLSFDDRARYYNDINTITYNLERDYIEYIKNFFIHHFPFDNFITQEIFDNETITKLLDNLEPLRMMKKEKRIKGENKKEKIKYILEIKLPKGGDAYKDFEIFKKNAMMALGGDHPLIKAYFNSMIKLT
jgi:hypothetical protein